jgi:hypothetical protein
MFALARNSWKFRSRDKRKNKIQHIEFESLAPDTIEEILKARFLLELWTGKAALKKSNQPIVGKNDAEISSIGRDLLVNHKDQATELAVCGEKMEKTRRTAAIIKPVDGYDAYAEMLHYYALKNLIEYLENNPAANFASMMTDLKGKAVRAWDNIGGQLIPTVEVDKLRADIGTGKLDTWENIHHRYDALWEIYPLEKQRHAFVVLCGLLGTDSPTDQQWAGALDKVMLIQEYVCEQVYQSRKKDEDNPFRQATYRNKAEMVATIGVVDDNSFIKQVRKETEAFRKTIHELKRRG